MHTTIVDFRRVFDDAAGVLLTAAEAQCRDGCRAVLQKQFLVGGIAPGLGHNLRAVARPDASFVRFDKLIDGRRIDEAFFDEQRFEGLDAQHDVRRRIGVVVIVMMVVMIVAVVVVMMFAHGGFLLQRRKRGGDIPADYITHG